MMDTSNNTKQKDSFANFEVRLSNLLDFLTEFLKATNNQTQLPNHNCYLELISRICVNLHSVEVLLPKLNDNSRFKLSVNLLLRSIIDDLINAFYLLSCTDYKEAEHSSLGNELNILNKELIINAKELIEEEQIIKKIDGYDYWENYEKQMFEKYPELYENKKLKTNNQIRETSSEELKKDLKNYNGNFITENKKLELIEKRIVFLKNSLKLLFKYFSQYHHYSPKNFDYIVSDQDFVHNYDLSKYNECLIGVFWLVSASFTFLNLTNKEELKSNFDEIYKITYPHCP